MCCANSSVEDTLLHTCSTFVMFGSSLSLFVKTTFSCCFPCLYIFVSFVFLSISDGNSKITILAKIDALEVYISTSYNSPSLRKVVLVSSIRCLITSLHASQKFQCVELVMETRIKASEVFDS